VLEIVAGHRFGPDSEERVSYHLIIEIMGRLSNIIFCDEHGLILGSLKRIGAEVNRYRTIAANVQYVPPPPQQRFFSGQTLSKLEPTTITAAQLMLCAADDTTSPEPSPAVTQKARKRPVEQPRLWQLLPKHLLGFSPLLSRESVYRATGNAETLAAQNDSSEANWEELAWNVRELAGLYDSHKWQPQLVERVGSDTEQSISSAQLIPLAFAPYVLEQYEEVPGVRTRQ